MILQKTGGLIEGPNGAARILDLNRSILRDRNEETGNQPQQPPNTVGASTHLRSARQMRRTHQA